MDHHPGFILDRAREKSIEELTHSLWLTTMELEATRASVQERDIRLNRLEYHLNEAINERNEARNKFQSLLLDKLLLQHQFHYKSNSISSSDCEESIENPVQLPEQGKFLEAVMKAGPLLQNLLLAGQLPHWRQPPPPLETHQIPLPSLAITTQPVDNCFEFNKKRGFSEDSVSSTETKYQRISIN